MQLLFQIQLMGAYIELPTGVAVAMIIVITIIINIILSISMPAVHNQHVHITNN